MINLLIAVSARHIPYAAVMLQSFYENHADADVTVYAISPRGQDTDWGILQRQAEGFHAQVVPIPVDEARFQDFPGDSSRWPRFLYFKLLAGEILPKSVDRVLFLESDMLITKPIWRLYETDFRDKITVSCSGDLFFQSLPRYNLDNKIRLRKRLGIPDGVPVFAGGLQLLNVCKMREQGVGFETLERLARRLDYTWEVVDETLFYALFYDSWLQIDPLDYQLYPSVWEKTRGDIGDKSAAYGSILHFTPCNKPWNSYALDTKCELDDLWWSYARKTERYDALRARFERRLLQREDVRETRRTLRNVDTYYHTLLRWKFMQDACGQSALSRYLLQKGIRRVAVYGKNPLQLILCNELEQTREVSVSYLVDSYESRETGVYPTRSVSACSFEDVDAVIIAAFLHTAQILPRLQSAPCPVLSLQDIIEELLPDTFNKYVQ